MSSASIASTLARDAFAMIANPLADSDAMSSIAGLFPPSGGGISEQRSEEHTSELQSLMRISYAVFCLKKKKNHKIPIELDTKNHLNIARQQDTQRSNDKKCKTQP